jgi:hypothetical protein
MEESEEGFLYLVKKEFEELDNESKWNYTQGLTKQLDDYKIMAEKSCGDCIYRLQTTSDVNVDLFFEDWRSCSDECDKCNTQQLKQMCQTQFELMSHMANSLLELQMKQNMLVKFLYRNDESARKLFEMMKKDKMKKGVADYFR